MAAAILLILGLAIVNSSQPQQAEFAEVQLAKAQLAKVTAAGVARGKCTITCECFPSVPFEGFSIYVVERCGSEEQWIPLEERPRQYDDGEACQKGIDQTPECN